MESRRAAVAAPESSPQSAISPAPTRTGSPEGDGDEEPVAADIDGPDAVDVASVLLARGVVLASPAVRLITLDRPKSKINVALNATSPSTTEPASERGPGCREGSLIDESLAPRLAHGPKGPFEPLGR